MKFINFIICFFKYLKILKIVEEIKNLFFNCLSFLFIVQRVIVKVVIFYYEFWYEIFVDVIIFEQFIFLLIFIYVFVNNLIILEVFKLDFNNQFGCLFVFYSE